MSKFLYWFSILTILVAIGLILYAAYLLFYPFKPFVLNTTPTKVLTKQVVAGNDLIYEVDYCRSGNSPAEVSRTVVGPTMIPTPVVGTITQPGCRKTQIHLPIPEGSTPGKYHLDVSAEFNPNPLRKIIVKFSTEEFEIIK